MLAFFIKNLLFYYLICFLLPNHSFIEVNPFLFVRGSWQPWYVHTICKYSYGYLAFYRQQTSSSSTAHSVCATLTHVFTVFFRIWNSANSLLQATSKQGRRNSHAFGCVVDELPPIPNPIPTQHVAQPGRATKESERERDDFCKPSPSPKRRPQSNSVRGCCQMEGTGCRWAGKSAITVTINNSFACDNCELGRQIWKARSV